MKAVALGLASLALVAPLELTPVQLASGYLVQRQQPDGGFAEVGGASDPSLTAWVVLGLKAAGRDPARLERDGASPAEYLAAQPAEGANALALRILALAALGQDVRERTDRLAAMRRPDGRIGPLVNTTIFGVLALRAAGRPAGADTVRYLMRRQRPGGGWSWAPRGAPDSNDTAAAIQALRAAGVRGKPISRGLAYLRRLQNPDGGFPLVPGRSSDAQSTAWAIQAFVAADAKAPVNASRFLVGLKQPSGSFRYSRRTAITPTWVTAQVLPALARKAFPLR